MPSFHLTVPVPFFLDRRNKACCNDLYRIETIEAPPTEEPEMPVVEIEPPPPAEPTTLEDFLPLALYYDNDEPDRRTRRTTTRKTYLESYQSYYSRKEEYLEAYIEPLEEEDIPSAEFAMEEFFEERVALGARHLELFSEILLARLQAGEQVEIYLKGFTSPRAESKYNEALGARRVSAVRNHFQEWQSGIFLPYLESGYLIISERSFGESTADTTISDSLEDLRNSVYSIEAAAERRVEIVEVKRN